MIDAYSPPIAIVGNLNVDQVIETVDRWPEWDEELLVESSELVLAGTAGYLALAAHGLGMDPFVVSTVGDDANGDFIRQSMLARSMNVDGVVTIPGQQTSLGLIFVGAAGHRAILTVLGAHAMMDVAVARSQQPIDQCREVFLCGNYLLPGFGPAAVLPYARELREAGKYVVFDPSWDPAGWPPQTRLDVLRLLEHVDLFMPNEPELRQMTGTTSWQDGAAAIATCGAELVVKRGEHGAAVVRDGITTEHPGYVVDAVNTIGAGDVFDMGFLYARRQGWSDARCLDFACATAALVVSQHGVRHYPSATDVLQFIETREAGK